jgi:uncharacterized protein YjdB
VSVGTTSITATLDGVFGSTDLSVTELTLVSIEIMPADPVMEDGSALQLTATAIYNDGSLIDITDVGAWTSSDPSVVGVKDAPAAAKGLVSAKKTGSETITVTYGGISGTTTVTVIPPL